jgi:hypothetical protein
VAQRRWLEAAGQRAASRPEPKPGDPGGSVWLALALLLLAALPFAALTPGEEALFEAIPRRRTTRAAYEERQVPAGAQGELVEEAAREGAWLHLVSDGEREAVAGLVAEGDRAQMGDKRFRRELAAWMHPNRSRAARGMRGYGFGFSDLLSLGSPLIVRTFDLGEGEAAKDREFAEHSPLLSVLGTAGDAPRDWLAAGQAMERVLLRACWRGLASSFLNQPVEVEPIRPPARRGDRADRDTPAACAALRLRAGGPALPPGEGG